jgi:2-amino-1-hydroxyethylphosphonate dioxygenase (glycine-forming)
MASDPLGPLALLTALYARSAGMAYAPGTSGLDLEIDPLAVDTSASSPTLSTSVGFLAHALQTAALAAAAHPADEELQAAALLHDVGWLLPKPSERELLTSSSSSSSTSSSSAAAADALFIARHDVTGSSYLSSLGFSPRVCRLVGGHVQAKRYLVATDTSYAATLSRGSAKTLEHQGGPMSSDEARAFEASPDHALITALRRWDESAKVIGKAVPDWESWQPLLARVLAASRFAPFSALEGGPRRGLEAVLPPGAREALGPTGKGYVVVRDWLSLDEVAALHRYASSAVPSMDAASVFHTYERTVLSGGVGHSRTEYFAHVEDADGVGARFLLAGRLRELCSALRGDREMALYKEKVNYKLKGGSGGYLAHQDYYHGFDRETGERLQLLPDSDVCVCMVAVDDMDGENGCPEVAEGWHTRGPLTFSGSRAWVEGGYAPTDGAQQPAVVDPATMVWTPVHLRAGDVLVYGNLMPHRSAENRSERDRRALFAVYADAEKHGRNIRELYYESERRGRRAAGSSRDGGKANLFFTGEAVLVG